MYARILSDWNAVEQFLNLGKLLHYNSEDVLYSTLISDTKLEPKKIVPFA